MLERTLRPVGVALLALFLAAPAAALEVEVSAPERVEVEVPWTMTVTVTATCEELSGHVPSLGDAGPEHRIDLQVEGVPGIALTGPESLTVPSSACADPQRTVFAVGSFDGVASMDAPGETLLPLVTTVTLDDEATTHEASTTVAWNGSVAAVVQESRQQEGPQKSIRYEFHLTNHANARTLVTFDLLDSSGFDGQVVLPEAVVLDSEGAAAQTTAVLVYSTPFKNGYNKVDEVFTVHVTPASAVDPEREGPTTQHDLAAQTRGNYLPGPGIAVVAVAVAVATVGPRVARRR